jgi:hypothetical protein
MEAAGIPVGCGSSPAAKKRVNARGWVPKGPSPDTVEVRAKTNPRKGPFDERSLCETDSRRTRSLHI